MNYGKALKLLRARLIITQTELAVLLGVSYVSVNRWENGKCVPTTKAKRKIADLCSKNKVALNP
jgi:putative transcriptional regulator